MKALQAIAFMLLFQLLCGQAAPAVGGRDGGSRGERGVTDRPRPGGAGSDAPGPAGDALWRRSVPAAQGCPPSREALRRGLAKTREKTTAGGGGKPCAI